MKKGDLGFFYHSNLGKEVVGIVEINKEHFIDKTDQSGRFVAVNVKFVKKFRKKYSQSTLTDAQIFEKILELDTNSNLCNGDLTNSSSNKMRKLLAKKKHLLKYLGTL